MPAYIPIRIGDRTALIAKPEKPGCSHPGCGWTEHQWRCSYPILRDGKPTPCGAKLCDYHAAPGKKKGERLCQPHARMAAKREDPKP